MSVCESVGECIVIWAVINSAFTHTHPDLPTPTHTLPKKGHTHAHPPTLSQKKVTLTQPTPTHTKPRKDHSPTPTHTQPKKGHSHPQPPTLRQKKVTLTHTHLHPDKKGHTQPKEGHTHPHITEIKNVMCLTHTYKYSLFKILAGFFIFEKD